MLAHRHSGTHQIDTTEVDLSQGETRTVGGGGQDVTPRVDDEGVSVAMPETPIVVLPDLGRGQNEALRFDGSSAEQGVPVILAGGLHRERETLEVKGLWWEPGEKSGPKRRRALERAVERFAEQIGARDWTRMRGRQSRVA